MLYKGEIQRVMSYSTAFEPRFAPILVNTLAVAADLMEEYAFFTETILILLAATMIWQWLRVAFSQRAIPEKKSIGVQTMIDENSLIQHLRAVASRWGLLVVARRMTSLRESTLTLMSVALSRMFSSAEQAFPGLVARLAQF